MRKTTPTEPAPVSHDADPSTGGSASTDVPEAWGRASGLAPSADDAPARPRKPRRQMTPAQRALSLLVRREHSRPELLRKLAARGVEPDAAIEAVDKMTEAGWQDDGRFAASLARSRASTGYGPLRIEAELSTHRLDSAQITAAFDALADDGEADWPQRARDLLERRYDVAAFAGDPALRRKAVDFLLRRGFDAETAYGAVRALRTD